MKKFLIIFLIIFLPSCEGEWSYSGRSAPKYWGSLKESYKFCKIGYNQSPIDIREKFEESDLKFFYSNSDVEKERKNYVMNINFFGKDYLLRGSKKYYLRKISFNHPSEHLIAGKPYSLELQIYHKSDDEQWLVLAIFLELGQENSEFKKIITLLSNKEKEAKINLAKIVKENSKSFFYDGSFTTPPCKEGVKWYVVKTPVEISKEQMNQIIKLAIFAKFNARNVQEFHPERY